MIDIGKYIKATMITVKNRKTELYDLRNAKDENIQLGKIAWHTGFRKYCFYPMGKTVLDSKCLQDIVNFLDKLNIRLK